MNKTVKYIIVGLSILVGIFGVWYYMHIVAYLLISAVLALIGRPVVDALGRIKYKNIKIPKGVRAMLTLILFWTAFVLFFRIFIPLIASELNELSNINTQQVLESLEEPLAHLEELIVKYQVDGDTFSVEEFVTQKLVSVFNVSFLTNFFGSIANVMGNIFIALFSITFITFFFLKDESLFSNGILMVVPDQYVESFKHALGSIRHLLRRYFIGILTQITGIFTLVTLGMTIIGVGFQHGIVIGLIAALFNIIPYLGPILGGSAGILLGIATHLHLEFMTELFPLILLMLLVIIIVQLVDNFIFQPLIYSNSVDAHPLEIFLVIMIAAGLAGITGMILAVPTYTVIRVFAKEFFDQFKVVKKLTSKMD